MPDHLSIDFFGIFHGAADGPAAVAILGVLASVLIVRLFPRLPRRWRRQPKDHL